ncbi:MAG: amidohydrolase [Deltaproteobacteria bacterium]|nr:amidohydrolase [Deltaproteobacteria bacterium]
MSLLLRRVKLAGELVDILCENGLIARIAPALPEVVADQVLEGGGKAVVPGLYNGHTHAAMTLFRGYADDMELLSWLTTKIWPLEEKLTEELVYHGARLACLEMIKSGTVFFNDMYWHFHGTAKAVEEMGLRAALSAVIIDLDDPQRLKDQIAANRELLQASRDYSERLQFVLGPHAIYTVSRAGLEWVRDFAEEHNLLIHLHLAETEPEIRDCLAKNGQRPVQYLADIGLLSRKLVAAHAVWLEDEEIATLAKHQVKVIHNPVSNMKLAVGRTFPYRQFAEQGVLMGLGTDGCASNNNLDMFETLKFSALLQKFAGDDPTLQPAAAAWRMASEDGAAIFGLAGGVVAEGRPADLLLLDTDRPEMIPGHNLVSDLVYSASGAVVDTTIVAGKVLMHKRRVEGEEEIIAAARDAARRLLQG